MENTRKQATAMRFLYYKKTSRPLIVDAEKSSGGGEGAQRSHKAKQARQSAAGFGPPLGAGFVLRRTFDPAPFHHSADKRLSAVGPAPRLGWVGFG